MTISRNWIGAVAALMLATTSLAKVQTEKTVDGRRMEISIDSVQFSAENQKGLEFVNLNLSGVDTLASEFGAVGEPRLPVLRFYVLGDASVILHDVKTETITLPSGQLLTPKQPDLEKRPGASVKFVFDRAKYMAAAKATNVPMLLEDAGSVRGVPQKLVTIFPVRYDAKENKILMMKTLTVEIRNEWKGASNDVDAPEMIAFVVGAAFENSPALARYMEHKQQQGFAVTKVVYGKDVTSTAALRAKLASLLADTANNLRHAIIVGDSSDVPAKSAVHMDGPTDHYYRAIDLADYETDINGPDIGLGRISVSTEAELATVVEKYLRYDAGIFTDASWLSKAAWVATSDGGNYDTAEGTHNHVIDTYAGTRGYVGSFPEAEYIGGDKLYAITHDASGTDLVAALREGRVMVTYSGHGYTGGWAGPDLDSADVRSLSNPDYMPFVLGFACDTGDYRGSGGIAETWQRHSFGAVLYWGSVDSSYWDPDDILEKRLYDGVFARGLRGFGDVLNYALAEHWRHYGGNGYSKYYWESYTTFADPTMALRVKE